jgi:pantetheine-phosphate adenylyltransferase
MKAVYAGSFDPPTLGHLHIILQGLRLFSDLTIAVAQNPAKKYTFTLDERKDMLEKMIAQATEDTLDPADIHEHRNWEIAVVGNEYLVDYAAKIGATHLIRGMRNVGDFEYERTMEAVNKRINPKIETVFLFPPVNLAEASSSLVKGLVGVEGWRIVVRQFVHPVVEHYLCDLVRPSDLLGRKP